MGTHWTESKNPVVVDASIAPRMDDAQVARMRRSGVSAFNWTVCEPQDDLPQALSEIGWALRFISSHEDEVRLIRSVSDIYRTSAEGKVGLIFGPQNSRPLECDAGHAEVLAELGVRILQLTYNDRNAFGDGCMEPSGAGLSKRGRSIIPTVERARIVLDVSHSCERTALDAIDVASKPVIISHGNARAVCKYVRNFSDDVLRAVAESGGVIGLNLWSPMVGDGGHQPTIQDFLKHVRYVLDLVGPSAVGIGSDHSEGIDRSGWDLRFGAGGQYSPVKGAGWDWYNYDTRFVKGAESCLAFPELIEEVRGIGLSDVEVRQIFGGNFIRVFEEIWGG